MPSPTTVSAPIPIKMLLIGDSGTGKTGALASLAPHYRLIVLDYDGEFNSSFLINRLRALSPSSLKNIYFETLRDKLRAAGPKIVPDGIPTAFDRGLKLLTHWKTESEDLGPSSSWKTDTIVVIDSFAFMCKAAFRWAQHMNTNPDERSTYFLAQQRAEQAIHLLCSPSLACHVIVTSHITYLEMQNGLNKGFPSAIGKALSPELPKYFNTMLEAKLVGGRRVISTKPSTLIGAKSAALNTPDEFPLETGLLSFFKLINKESSSNA